MSLTGKHEVGSFMDVEFADDKYDRLEVDPHYLGGFSAAVVSLYRRRMQAIRAAVDERAFYALKSLHFEKLQGDRSHQRSMRLNRKWRLILELIKREDGTVVVVVSIEDYH
jgi:toxin HigB-1